MTSNDLLLLAVEALRAVDQSHSPGPAIESLLERVGAGEVVGVSGIPLSHVVVPDLAAEVAMETLRRFRTSQLSSILVEQRERQLEEEAAGLFRADMKAATM